MQAVCYGKAAKSQHNREHIDIGFEKALQAFGCTSKVSATSHADAEVFRNSAIETVGHFDYAMACGMEDFLNFFAYNF